MSAGCDPPQAPGPVCVRGTVGCRQSHEEPTLLEQLDAAEKRLHEAEGLLSTAQNTSAAIGWGPDDSFVRSAEVRVQAASALCMAAAARCLVTTEDISDGPVQASQWESHPDAREREWCQTGTRPGVVCSRGGIGCPLVHADDEPQKRPMR